ncbi:hypothetical protein AAC387_Pa07g0213 [Persea americana]
MLHPKQAILGRKMLFQVRGAQEILFALDLIEVPESLIESWPSAESFKQSELLLSGSENRKREAWISRA